MNDFSKLRNAISKASRIVVFTGAGISCPPPTNIPDFRSANGLYSEKVGNVSPEEIISHSFFMKNPKEFYSFYGSKMVYRNASCNEAHKYFAALEDFHDVTIVTQNIDGLHQKAGSTKVFELHGSVHRNYCMRCHKFYKLDDIDVLNVPYCDCGGIIKPDVVLYEEGLDEECINGAIKAISEADLMIVVGTSLTVYPAASFVRYFRGNTLCLINKSETQYDSIADLVYNCDILEAVRALKGE